MSSGIEKPSQQICILMYQASEHYGGKPIPGTDLLVATIKETGELSLFVNAQWRDFVSSKHQEYMHDLFEDCKARKRVEPEVLFQEVSHLQVGPILVRELRPLDEGSEQVPPGFNEII
jgi:hypothetical protein